MSHANAALTPRARLRLAQPVVDGGWTGAGAAKMFMVSPRTAAKWVDRYRLEGPAGMVDRSSRPHTSPTKTPPKLVKAVVRARWRHRLGPVQIGGRLGMSASTVHAVLTRCRINRLRHIDRVSGEPLRRYEHEHPGSLIHVDVTKFANIPDGGGWRYVGKAQGDRNRSATVARTGTPRSPTRGPLIGTAFVHTVIDDHSRAAYAECAWPVSLLSLPGERRPGPRGVVDRHGFRHRAKLAWADAGEQRLFEEMSRAQRLMSQRLRDEPENRPQGAGFARMLATYEPEPVRVWIGR